MGRKKKEKAAECSVCFGCKWVFNDASESPFYDLNFSNLRTGDELIRCRKCNSVPGTIYTNLKAKPQAKQNQR